MKEYVSTPVSHLVYGKGADVWEKIHIPISLRLRSLTFIARQGGSDTSTSSTGGSHPVTTATIPRFAHFLWEYIYVNVWCTLDHPSWFNSPRTQSHTCSPDSSQCEVISCNSSAQAPSLGPDPVLFGGAGSLSRSRK